MFVDRSCSVPDRRWYRDHGPDLSHAVDRVLPKARQLAGFAVEPNAMSDVQVAYYRAVQNLARLSYQAIIAATFVIFPLVSKSTFDDDQDTTKRYVTVTMRYSLIFATAIAVVMAANPRPLLDIPYADDYATLGAPALMALALGNVAFSLFAIAGTILNGAGFTRDAIIGAAVTLTLAAVGNFIAIPRCDPGQEVLVVAACTTGVAMMIGAGVCGWFLHKRLGAFVPWPALVRVALAVAAAIGVGRVIPFKPAADARWSRPRGRRRVLVAGSTRELGKADLRSIAPLAPSAAAEGSHDAREPADGSGRRWPACMPPSTRGAALYDAARTYTEGVRWERFEAAAAVVPPAERAAFLDERDVLAKDLRITDSEITRVDQHGRTAEVSVKHAWYKDSEGTLRETVVRQAWERQGKAWRLVDEYRARGDAMPGVRERDPDPDPAGGTATSAPNARGAED
jgi:hypothetical protein